jgi:hypothetical protein
MKANDVRIGELHLMFKLFDTVCLADLLQKCTIQNA